MSAFIVRRLGLVMEPEPGNPQEVEGVLNPAAARGPDGALYLFPRLVAQGNYSRIGIAGVRFDAAGDPSGVERRGIALEPEADYERRSDGGGGCEDPRITFVEPLQCYLMTYTALSDEGPRIALALSGDLIHWQRLGLATFSAYQGIDLDSVDDEDVVGGVAPSSFPIRPGAGSWPCSIGRCFRALVRRKPPATPRAGRWISTGRASGFPTARWPWKAVIEIALAGSPHHRLATPVSPRSG